MLHATSNFTLSANSALLRKDPETCNCSFFISFVALIGVVTIPEPVLLTSDNLICSSTWRCGCNEVKSPTIKPLSDVDDVKFRQEELQRHETLEKNPFPTSILQTAFSCNLINSFNDPLDSMACLAPAFETFEN